jgi:uncharacterized protein YeaC (DUF1315 family)
MIIKKILHVMDPLVIEIYKRPPLVVEMCKYPVGIENTVRCKFRGGRCVRYGWGWGGVCVR